MVIEQAWKADGRGGTALGFGASVYDAAFVLGDYVHRNSATTVAGKRVIELGAGLGFTSLAAVLGGSSAVVSTDGDAELLELTAKNINTNLENLGRTEIQHRVRVMPLLWGDEVAIAAARGPFDVVLVADCVACVYEEAFVQLVETLRRLCFSESKVLCAYHRRHEASESQFFLRFEQYFTVEYVNRETLHPDFQRHEAICVFEARPKDATAPAPLPASTLPAPPASLGV